METHYDTYSNNVWDVTVARSAEDIETLRPIWEQMQKKEPCPNINADIDRFLSILKSSGGDIQPYIILIKKNSLPVAMVLAQTGRVSVELRIGYKTLLRPKLRLLSVIHGGIIGQADDDLCRLIVHELMRELNRVGLDAVYFDRLKMNSLLYLIARKMPGVLSRGYFPRIDAHWAISIPENTSLFYKRFSALRRNEYKRYIRKLDHSHSVRVVCYHREEDVDEAVRRIQEISVKTYQHAMGVGFDNDFACQVLLNTAARRGWLRAHVLFVDDKPAAFQIGLRYGKVYFAQHIGFDPYWKKEHVGTVLLLKVIEELCEDPSVSEFDFGFGDADYKQRYSDKSSPDASFYIFARRFYPVSVNMLQSVVLAVSSSMTHCLRQLGLVNWVKRKWRDLLASKSMQKNTS